MSTMTVGQFRKMLSQHPRDMEITFGAATFSKSALVFYRTKIRGEDLVLIEVNELAHIDDWQIPDPEYDKRITVEDLLMHLEDIPDHWQLGFNCTEDAMGLFFHSMKPVLAIDLEQSGKPEWRQVCHDCPRFKG